MIDVQVDGVIYDGFSSISVESAVDQLCDKFTLECTASDVDPFPIKRGSDIEIYVNEIKIMTGIVEIIKGSYDSESYNISVQGRDITRQVIKTDLPPKYVIKGPIQLKDIMEKTLADAFINLSVIDLTGGIDDYSSKEIMTDDVGSSIWDFWVALAEKRKVLITKDRDSNIIIRNPNDTMYDMTLRQLIIDPGNENNILSANFEYNDSERRREYNVRSQANVAVQRDEPAPSEAEYWQPAYADQPQSIPQEAKNAERLESLKSELATVPSGSEQERVLIEEIRALSPDAKPLTKRVRTNGLAIDEAIVDGVCFETAENPSDDDECQRLAEWKCNKHRAESVSYSCKVEQILVDGEPWEAGNLIQVIDEKASIDSLMLINTVEFVEEISESGDVDEFVNLNMTVPDAYSQQAVPTDAELQSNTIGRNWNIGGFQ